ncbi:MAG: undecaprenyl-diphosphate phosphatase [Psittacicella sp.]
MIFIALILGIIQGLTEFIPVSSTGHLILVGHFLDFKGSFANVFEVVVEVGAILAVVALYFKRCLSLVGIKTKEFQLEKGKPHLNAFHIIVSMLPALVVGFLFHKYINTLFTPMHVVYSLFIGGIFLIFAECIKPKKTRVLTIDEVSYKDAFFIGLFQCLALYPGFSRSGSTIGGAVILGFSRKAAVEYSFLLAIPMMVAASSFDIYTHLNVLTLNEVPIFLVGLVAAFIVALLTIKFFLKLIQKYSLVPFGIYRIILSIILFFVILH